VRRRENKEILGYIMTREGERETQRERERESGGGRGKERERGERENHHIQRKPAESDRVEK
jgi:hypothetical protein